MTTKDRDVPVEGVPEQTFPAQDGGQCVVCGMLVASYCSVRVVGRVWFCGVEQEDCEAVYCLTCWAEQGTWHAAVLDAARASHGLPRLGEED